MMKAIYIKNISGFKTVLFVRPRQERNQLIYQQSKHDILLTIVLEIFLVQQLRKTKLFLFNTNINAALHYGIRAKL